MANSSTHSNLDPFANSPILSFDNPTNMDIFGFDFDLFDKNAESTAPDDLNLLLSDLNNDIGHFSPSSDGNVNSKDCKEEELFRAALTVYYNAGQQSFDCDRTRVENYPTTECGVKRNHCGELLKTTNNSPYMDSVATPEAQIPQATVYNDVLHNANGAISAASMAAAMIAAQQGSKKKKITNVPQRRNSKTLKKDEKPVLPAISSEKLVTNISNEKKINNLKEKPIAPIVPVLPAFLAPPPIPGNDPRRNLCKIVMNAFHSCDIKKLREVLEQHGSSNDIVEIHRYEGIQNPHGRNYSRIEGLENILQLWMALFKCTPDFCFDLFNHKTYYDPDWHVIVCCQYTMVGTRIMDVKISQPIASMDSENNISETLIESDGSPGTTDSCADSVATPSSTCSTATAEESLFAGKELIIPNCAAQINGNMSTTSAGSQQQSAKIYLDTTTTLKQPCQLRYQGKFSVFLDEFQKICKLEFVYTAMEEEMIGIPVAVPGKAAGGNVITIAPSINRASIKGNIGNK